MMRDLNIFKLLKICTSILIVFTISVIGGAQKIYAAGGTVIPDTDVTTNWSCTANGNGSCHSGTVDEGTEITGDYLNTGTAGSGGEVEELGMSSVAGSTNSVSQVIVNFRAQSFNNSGVAGCNSTCDTVGVAVRIDGVLQTVQTQTMTASDTLYQVTFNGTWTGDDDLQIQFTRNVLGSGPTGNRDDDVRIYQVNASVTYTPSPPSQVVFTNSSRTLTAGACNGAASVFTMVLEDSGNTPTNPTGSTVIRVTSNSSSYTIYSDSSCTNQVTNGDFTYTTADNTISVYIIDNKKSITTRTLTGTQQSGPDTISTGAQNYTVNPGTANTILVVLPGQSFTDGSGVSGTPDFDAGTGGVQNATAGTAFSVTLKAVDANNNLVDSGANNYTGSKTFSYSSSTAGNSPSGQSPSFPSTTVSFTNGTSTSLSFTYYNATSGRTVRADDSGTPVTGTASTSFTIDAGTLNDFLVTATTPQTAGVCFTGTNSITARDTWQNTRSSDTSVVNMTTTGLGVTFYTSAGCSGTTTQYTLSSGTITIYVKTNKKQSMTVTATKDLSTETGTSGSVTVDPAAVSTILVVLPNQAFTDGTGVSGSTSFTGTRSPNATAGTSYSIDLKAVDAFNNLVDSGSNNYNGSKTISFSNSTAGNSPSGQSPSFPSSSVTFTNGSASSLSVTYYNAATSRTVRADDTDNTITGTASTSFTVQAGMTNTYGIAPAASSQTAGVGFNVTITAQDQWQNPLGSLYSAPSGSYTWSTSGSNAPDGTSPSLGALAQGDFSSGVATKNVTLYKAESGVTFTASEPSPSSVTGTSSTTVTASAGNVSADASDSSVSGLSTATTNENVTITITLKDTWRNPRSGIAAANITLESTGGSITQPSAATDASGQTTGTISWSSTGNKTVLAAISGVSLVQNDGSTADTDGYLDDTHALSVTAPGAKSIIRGGTTIRGGTSL